ncbi:hypothetical protein KAI46_10895 [bacterium]|nr:hypothetical protein [bacterium]
MQNTFESDLMGSAVTLALALPPDENSLLLLPLFSSEKLEEVTVAELHPGFYVFNRIEDLSLPVSTVNRLKNVLGIMTVGEVILTPGTVLLEQSNFGEKKLAELKKIFRTLCLGGRLPINSRSTLISETIVIDYTSYENMVSEFISQCVRSKRDQELFKIRLCFSKGKVPSTKQIGNIFEISGGRVQQIFANINRELKRKYNLEKLSYFMDRLDYCVAQRGGVANLNTLPSLLQSEFKWPSAPYSLALKQLLLFCQRKHAFRNNDDLFFVE